MILVSFQIPRESTHAARPDGTFALLRSSPITHGADRRPSRWIVVVPVLAGPGQGPGYYASSNRAHHGCIRRKTFRSIKRSSRLRQAIHKDPAGRRRHRNSPDHGAHSRDGRRGREAVGRAHFHLHGLESADRYWLRSRHQTRRHGCSDSRLQRAGFARRRYARSADVLRYSPEACGRSRAGRWRHARVPVDVAHYKT